MIELRPGRMAVNENVKKRLFYLGAWTFLVLYYSIDFQINLRARGVLIPLWQPLYYNFVYFYLWALLSTFIIKWVRWLKARNVKILVTLLVQLPSSLILAFFHNVAQFYLNILTINIFNFNISPIFRDENFRIFSLRYFTQNVWIYWIVVGVIYLIDYYRLSRENELRSARLEVQLVQSQLHVLKMQIHPHFLFNTITSIVALMHDDAVAAERMAIKLSDFLRYTLESINRQEVLLKDEIEFVRGYLDIEKVRLQDRLNVTVDVDPDTLPAYVPNLMLQPLVENSVRHGIIPFSKKGHISLSCKSMGKNLWIQVRDDGPGFPLTTPSNKKKGGGLANIEKRLKTLYDKQGFKFTYANHPGGGAVVEIIIPLMKKKADETKFDLP
jgi:two-component system LytT family sensor kinase